jgi:hypothetical protein
MSAPARRRRRVLVYARYSTNALDALMDTEALILDLRSNNGGDLGVVMAILGRFVHGTRPDAIMRERHRVRPSGDGLGRPQRGSRSVSPLRSTRPSACERWINEAQLS